MELLKFLFAVVTGFILSVIVLLILPAPLNALALFAVAGWIIRSVS